MTEQRRTPPEQRSAERWLVPADEPEQAVTHPNPSVPAQQVPTQPQPWSQPASPVPAAPALPPGHAVGQMTNVNVTTNVAGPTVVFSHRNTAPGFFIRALWYLFIGWWASAVTIVIAYLALFTFIGIPLAFFLFNRLPTILTLRPRTERYTSRTEDGITYVELGNERQRPWYQRLAYFLLIGWWFGAVWLVFAWAISIFIITLPLTFWMFNRASGVMTLHRH